MALLSESDVIQVPVVRSNASACLNMYNTAVYKLEKVTDILLNILRQRGSSDVKIVEEYKSSIEGLKSYMNLSDDGLQINIKEAYTQIFQVIGRFPEKVIDVAKRNSLEGFAKYAKEIPTVSLNLMNAFNIFMSSALSAVHTQGQHAVQEMASLHEAQANGVIDYLGNIGSGASKTMSSIINMFSFSGGSSAGKDGQAQATVTSNVDSALTRASRLWTNLKNDWNSTIGATEGGAGSVTLSDIGNFLRSESFGQAVGAIGVCTAIFFGLRWLWGRLRRAFSSSY